MSFKKYASEEYVDGKIVCPDMSINDESNPAYVKNRTHWDATYYGELLPETTIVNSDALATLAQLPNLNVNSQYTVVWNGTEYSVTCFEFTDGGMTCPVLGNGVVFGGTDTREPFAIARYPEDFAQQAGFEAVVVFVDGSTEATISISGYVGDIYKLDIKYIPIDPVPTVGSMNPVASDGVAKAIPTEPKDVGLNEALLLKNVPVSTMPSSGPWYVTYGKDKFIAVKDSAFGYGAYSVDGITWISTRTGIDSSRGVVYGGSMFVAIGGHRSDEAAYSSDGITWSVATLPVSFTWSDIAFGNGVFVAIGSKDSDSKAVYSKNGITWTSVDLPRMYDSIAYGNDKFVAICNGGGSTKAAYSADGIAWTETSLPESWRWDSVTYGGDKFVAVANDTGKIAYSADGITWELTSVSGAEGFYLVTYGDGKFVAAPNLNGTQAAYSIDGITWELTDLPKSANWQSIAYGKDKFIMTDYSSNQVTISEDGVNWRDSTLAFMTTDGVNKTEEIAEVLSSPQTSPQADLNQNDSTAPDYVKNRTHWKEYNDPTEVFLLPETNLTFSDNMAALTLNTLPIEDGVAYIANWNGAKIECIAQTVDVDGIPCVAIGNHGAMLGTDDTGEPFLVLALPDEYIAQIGAGSLIYSLDGSTSATFSLSTIDDGIVTHHLDPTYIKDMYYTERVAGVIDVLPETTVASANSITDIPRLGLIAGKTYIVNWNGVDYECVCVSIDTGNSRPQNSLGDVYTASNGRLGTSATGEPFSLIELSPNLAESMGYDVELTPLDDSATITISIQCEGYTETIHKIDEKYLPSFIAKNIVDGASIGSLRTSGSYIEDFNEYTMGDYAFAEGCKSKASGYASHAEGDSSASGDYSHAEGCRTIASNDYSHAEGNNTTASGNNSHAEGSNTTASGYYSHAEGYRTTASNYNSHAEGSNTTASGNNSHAEGSNTTASGDYSHAEGNNTTASGLSSHAEGYRTTASGNRSHAEGSNTTANSMSQHVQGEYNIPDTEKIAARGTYAHIVGNGTSSVRSNAHTLDWSGNAWFAGDVYVGSTSGTNKDEGSKKLATEEYVDNAIASSGGSGSGGTTDLTNYYTKTEVDALIPDTYTKTEIDTIMGSYINDIDTLLGGDA